MLLREVGLATHLPGLAEREHDLVGGLGRGHRLVEPLDRLGSHRRAVVRWLGVRQSQVLMNVVVPVLCALIPL